MPSSKSGSAEGPSAPTDAHRPHAAQRERLAEVARLFLRLGATSFGGPAAHIAAMEAELVERRRWVTPADFLDLLSATNLIPGPNSTELAMHLGWRRAGWPGLLVAGSAFIAPATVCVWLIAMAYHRFGGRPDAAAFLLGMQPVVLAVIVHAVWRLARSALRTPSAVAIAILSVVAVLTGVHELLILIGAIVVGLFQSDWKRQAHRSDLPLLAAPAVTETGAAAVTGVATATIVSLPSSLGVFGAFLKIGSVLFGSGYVLVAFMRAELVQRQGWLTETQLLDAIAIGQLTPGPVFSAATFAGFLMAGHGGAVAATVGIFLPAFVFVALSGPWVRAIRRSPRLSTMLDAVNAASLALLLAVALLMLRTVATSGTTIGIFVLATVVLFRFSAGVGSVLLGGAVIGVLRWAMVAAT